MSLGKNKSAKDKFFGKQIVSIPLEYILVVILSFVLIFLLVGSIYRESPVFDELAFVPAGYSFLTSHDFRMEPFNPPLARELVALPMLFVANILNDRILLLPRLVVVFFTFCLGMIVYLFAKKLYGIRAGLFALLLYVFEPEVLANGHYAMTDMISTFFFILTLFLYFIFRRSFNYKKLLIFSVIFGLALATKFTNLIYLSLSIGALLIFDKKQALLKLGYWRSKTKFILIFVFFTLFSLWLTYFFTFEPLLGYRFDPHRAAKSMAKQNPLINFALNVPVPLGSYISTIKEDLRTNYTTDFPKQSVFWGTYSQNGFYGYLLLVVLLIKTPIPFLIFFIFSIIYFRYRNKNSLILLIPMAVIIASTLFTHVILVLRYIFSVIPLMIIYVSRIINIKFRRIYSYYIFLVLIIWYIVGTLLVYPHFLSYANELIGGEKNSYKYLSDGNLDSGQGLIDLADYLKTQKINNLQLAYMGTALPSNYGISYMRIKDVSMNDKKKIVPIQPKNHTIAISVTSWYFCGYYNDQIAKNLKLVDLVGGSILIFK